MTFSLPKLRKLGEKGSFSDITNRIVNQMGNSIIHSMDNASKKYANCGVRGRCRRRTCCHTNQCYNNYSDKNSYRNDILVIFGELYANDDFCRLLNVFSQISSFVLETLFHIYKDRSLKNLTCPELASSSGHEEDINLVNK
uniref:Uncharacterized protein n=1 Tax=Romanomermis culicivorax TaxID=13658 RepID=A0A915KUD3_ROMCU